MNGIFTPSSEVFAAISQIVCSKLNLPRDVALNNDSEKYHLDLAFFKLMGISDSIFPKTVLATYSNIGLSKALQSAQTVDRVTATLSPDDTLITSVSEPCESLSDSVSPCPSQGESLQADAEARNPDGSFQEEL